MSSHGGIGLELIAIAHLIKSIVDLNRQYKELTTMQTTDGKIYKVDLVTTDDNGRNIGFQKTEKGNYKVIADCAGLNSEQLKKQNNFVKQIRQRYSYNKVIEDLKKQGYIVAEEEKVQNNTIRLVARKWS
ncbi:MAG: DUF1257 domain-containing protein [Candidatus Omnitrophica bacterium]|nr:DUF1257 domain-containing protein [Candidatus Omnitrophota bacterium]